LVLARNGNTKKSFIAKLAVSVFVLFGFLFSLYVIFSYFGTQKTGATDW